MRLPTYLKRRRIQFAAALILSVGLAVIVRPGATVIINSYAACTQAGYPVLDTDPPVCRAGSHNFTGAPLPSSQPAATLASLPFEILVDGDTRSPLPAERQDFIDSQAGWVKFWGEVHAGLATPPPLIPVDFTISSVVAVSLGRQPTSGFVLKITDISQTPAGTAINYTVFAPTITCQVGQQPSNRYLIVRTSKLTEPVSFHLTSQLRHCP